MWMVIGHSPFLYCMMAEYFSSESCCICASVYPPKRRFNDFLAR